MMRWLIPCVLAIAVCVAWVSDGPAADPMDPIVGTYAWQNGNTVVISANGTAKAEGQQGNQQGKWILNPFAKAPGSGYVIIWEGNFLERVHLGPRGHKLTGMGLTPEGKTYAVNGTRK